MDQARIAQKIRDTAACHHGVEDAGIREEVAHQQQGDELGHRDGHHEQSTPQLGQLGLFVVDEHCQQNAAKEGGEGGKERPDQRPGQHLAEGVSEGCGQAAAAKQREEIGETDPCEQIVGRHVLLVIVGEGHRDEDEQRHDGKDNYAKHRQGQQGDVEFFV